MARKHYLNRFWLIQEGKIIRNSKSKKVVNLSYMGAAEFEFHAVDYSYIRMFKNLRDYRVYLTGITNPDGKELVLYCNKNESKRILRLIKKYVEKPYYLKSYSNLQYVPTLKELETNFWWCIDNCDDIGDWMLFFEDDADIILDSIRFEYHQKWVPLSKEMKEKIFEIAQRGYK